MEQIEQDYEQYTRGLKWQLIENKIIKKHGINISQEELTDHVKLLLRQQFANMGQGEIDDQILNDTVGRVMENKDEISRINDQLFFH